METAVRFSQNSLEGVDQRFLNVDVVGKVFKLCKITKRSKQELSYQNVATSTKVPPFRAFDWHPKNEDLVVVGQASGEATLLNIAEGQQDSVSFQVRSQRLCNAVSLNSENLLAAGLDRVRTDVCLNIWDFNQRLPAEGETGFSKNYSEPLHKLASGEPISSLKFFQDDPQLLVAGVKGQFVRLYDLREPSSSNGLQFATRCVNSLAIDWRDENYFASCIASGDPTICLWDRRMTSRTHVAQVGFNASSSIGNGQPEVSMELKQTIEQPGSIWSLRFAKSRRGCLGVLSSTGHLKVFQIGKDFVSDSVTSLPNEDWETATPQPIYIDRTQDIEKPFSHPSALKDEKHRIVSFDFTTSMSKNQQLEIITLTGDGHISITTPTPVPEPSDFEASGRIAVGNSLLTLDEIGEPPSIEEILTAPKDSDGGGRSQDEAIESSAKTLARKSSFQKQQLEADPRSSLLTLRGDLVKGNVMQKRCEAGYLLDPSINKQVVSDNEWLLGFWEWIEQATALHQNRQSTQDNFDLSFLGVHSIWMEDIPNKSVRTLGPTTARISKTIENLGSRLRLPPFRGVSTEYLANRQLCLYLSNLAWSSELLQSATKQLTSQGEHFRAAFIALAASETDLAHEILTGPSSTQSHKLLSLAIAGSHRQLESSSSSEAWKQSINALADEIEEPYALAILAYVRRSSWSTPLINGELDGLNLYHRTGLALRHLSDSQLTSWVSNATRTVVAEGDIEGVILTGLASPLCFDLFSKYLTAFNDLQTTVLALATVVPRYLNDANTVRRFNSWKEAYRNDMNSWGLHIRRARFDVDYAKIAVDNTTGDRLIKPPPPQIRLVCSYCAGSIAHHEVSEGVNGHGKEGEGTVMHSTEKNPLPSATAAATGTVCPKCGRHLPRCGVCDLWLGGEDDSYMKWAGKKGDDPKVNLSGSAHTILGPDAKGITKDRGSSGGGSGLKAGSMAGSLKVKGRDNVEVPEKAVEVEKKMSDTEMLDERMARFISYCVKCSHAFHWKHARMWFEGDPDTGRQGHRFCPVPKCECFCYEGGL